MIAIDTKNIIIAVLVVAIIACVYGVYNLDGRIKQVGSELNTIRTEQQSVADRLGKIETGLTDSIKRVDTAQNAIDDASGRIDQSQSGANTSAELITDSKRIIETVRNRK